MANYLANAKQTSVKFYASLTRNQAKGLDSIGNDKDGNPIYIKDEPGAICFVADELGNSIFMNTRLFGDGASSGGGGGGLTEVTLSDIVVVQKDGEVLKTLADFFNADGTVVSDTFKVVTTKTNAEGTEYQVNSVVIDANGITVSGSRVLTESDVESLTVSILGSANTAAQGYANTAEENAKQYAKSLIDSVYKIRGSVESYSNLKEIEAPTSGDVYNVIKEQGIIGKKGYIPGGTNYVYVTVTDPNDENYPGYWDSLGGIIDLSAYKTASDTTIEIDKALKSAKTYTDNTVSGIDGRIGTVEGSITTLSARITTNTDNIGTLTTSINQNASKISANTTNITNIATQLTWQ